MQRLFKYILPTQNTIKSIQKEFYVISTLLFSGFIGHITMNFLTNHKSVSVQYDEEQQNISRLKKLNICFKNLCNKVVSPSFVGSVVSVTSFITLEKLRHTLTK
jgi:hypothetical protein